MQIIVRLGRTTFYASNIGRNQIREVIEDTVLRIENSMVNKAIIEIHTIYNKTPKIVDSFVNRLSDYRVVSDVCKGNNNRILSFKRKSFIWRLWNEIILDK